MSIDGSLAYPVSRRAFITSFLAAPAAFAASSSAPRAAMGVGTASYHLRSRYDRQADRTPITETITFVEYCRDIGAGGVQAGISSLEPDYLKRLRTLLDDAGMYFEASLRLPPEERDVEAFDKSVEAASELGALAIRTVLFRGRRYETYDTLEAFEQDAERAWKALTLAEPVVRKRGMKLAIENHKNLRIPDMLRLIERIDSEYVGVCVDFGNNVALLEDPLDVVTAFAPYAYSSHIKDHSLYEYEKGFLLEDAPLGEGYLDLSKMVKVLQEAQPELKFTLETMTRDPLEIPALDEKYWVTFPDLPATDLARTLATVRKTEPNEPPVKVSALSREEQIRLEDENVRKGLAYGREKLGL